MGFQSTKCFRHIITSRIQWSRSRTTRAMRGAGRSTRRMATTEDGNGGWQQQQIAMSHNKSFLINDNLIIFLKNNFNNHNNSNNNIYIWYYIYKHHMYMYMYIYLLSLDSLRFNFPLASIINSDSNNFLGHWLPPALFCLVPCHHQWSPINPSTYIVCLSTNSLFIILFFHHQWSPGHQMCLVTSWAKEWSVSCAACGFGRPAFMEITHHGKSWLKKS